MGWFRRTPPDRSGVADEVTPADPGWRGVDRLDPTLAPMPVTVETAAFEAGLPSRGIPRWVRPLTHGRSAAAPGGLADGIVTLSTAVEARRGGLIPLDVAPAAVEHRDGDGPPPPDDDLGTTTPTADARPGDAPPIPPGPRATPVAPSLPPHVPVVARLSALGPSPGVRVPGASDGPAAAGPRVPSAPAHERDVPLASATPPASPAVEPPNGSSAAPPGEAPRDQRAEHGSPAGSDSVDIPTPVTDGRRIAHGDEQAAPKPLTPPTAAAGAASSPPDSAPPVVARRIGLGAPLPSRPAGPLPTLRQAGPGVPGRIDAPVGPGTVSDAPEGPDVPSASTSAHGSAPSGAALSEDAPMLADQPLRGVSSPDHREPPRAAADPVAPLPPPGRGTEHDVSGTAPSAGPEFAPPAPGAVPALPGSAPDARPRPDLTPRPEATPRPVTTRPVTTRPALPPRTPDRRPAEVPTLARRPITPVLRSTAAPGATPDRVPAAAPQTPEVPPRHVRAAAEVVTGVALDDSVVHRSPAASAAAERIGARAFTTRGEAHVPAEAGSLLGGEAAGLAAHELVHVAQQRTLGSSRPLEGTGGGRALEARAERAADLARLPLAADDPRQSNVIADPGDAAVRAGVAERDPDGSIVFSAPPSDPPSEAAVQRAPVGAPAPAPGGAGGAEDNEKLEQLAKQLYDKIRDRLKAELRLDRERWGRVTDLSR